MLQACDCFAGDDETLLEPDLVRQNTNARTAKPVFNGTDRTILLEEQNLSKLQRNTYVAALVTENHEPKFF